MQYFIHVAGKLIGSVFVVIRFCFLLFIKICTPISMCPKLVNNLNNVTYYPLLGAPPEKNFKMATSKGHSCQMDQNFKRWDMTHLRFWFLRFQMKGMYEIRLSWKFQHKLIAHSKIITPQIWHGKLKIDKTRGVKQLGCIFESQ